jgi:hypothetical protein
VIFYPFCLDFLIESWFKKSCDSIVVFYYEPHYAHPASVGIRAAFLPHNYTQAMYQSSQSWTHGSRSVNGYMEKPCKEKTHVEMMEPKYQSISRYNRSTCRQFQTTYTMRGKVVSTISNYMHHERQGGQTCHRSQKLQ